MIDNLQIQVFARTFGERLRQTRIRQNVSQAYMAQILGVSTPTYRKVEAGISTVEWGVILRALQFLELDTDKLLSVFPTQEPPMKLKDLLAPTRKNAYRRKFHGKTNM